MPPVGHQPGSQLVSPTRNATTARQSYYLFSMPPSAAAASSLCIQCLDRSGRDLPTACCVVPLITMRRAFYRFQQFFRQTVGTQCDDTDAWVFSSKGREVERFPPSMMMNVRERAVGQPPNPLRRKMSMENSRVLLLVGPAKQESTTRQPINIHDITLLGSCSRSSSMARLPHTPQSQLSLCSQLITMGTKLNLQLDSRC